MLFFFKNKPKECLDQLSQMKEHLHTASQFILEIENGNLYAENQNLINRKDPLSEALISLQEKMQAIDQEEKQRKWANEGFAQFAEHLQIKNTDLQAMGKLILGKLVEYTKASMGGLFIYEEANEGSHLSLLASFAYERSKFIHKKLLINEDHAEGLVGEVFIEKKTRHYQDVPINYQYVLSGLTTGTNQNLLLVPLIANEQCFGVIELTALKPFENYQVEFIEKLGESIASTISFLKSSLHTHELLERFQSQTESLKAQEEELRQNMEEMEAIHEARIKNEREMDSVLTAISTEMVYLEMNLQGFIQQVNSKFIDLMGFTNEEEVLGTNFQQFQDDIQGQTLNTRTFWENLRAGVAQSGDWKYVNQNKQLVWLKASFTPINEKGKEAYKIIMIGNDITQQRKTQQNSKQLSLVAQFTNNSVLIKNKSGQIEYVNPSFEKLTGYSFAEIQGKTSEEFLHGPDTDQQTIQKITERLDQGMSTQDEILHYNRLGKSYWVRTSINPILDNDGAIEKYIEVQSEITEIKTSLLDFEYKQIAIEQVFGVIEFTPDGFINKANHAFCDLMGYELKEIQDQHHRIFVKPEYAQSTEYQNFWQNLANGKSLSGEFTRVNKKGDTVYLLGSYNAVKDSRNNILKVIKYVQDITAQKVLEQENQSHREMLQSQEEELRQNMEELQAIQEELHIRSGEMQNHLLAINRTLASVEFDTQGQVLKVNKRFAEIMGYQPNELIGKPHRVFVDYEYAQTKEYQKFWYDLSQGFATVSTFKRYGKDGKEVWISASYTPIFGKNGKVQKILKLAYDITQQFQISHRFERQYQAIEEAFLVLELSPQGIIEKANANFLDLMGYGFSEIQGRHHRLFIKPEERNSENYKEFWHKLSQGNIVSNVFERLNRAEKLVHLQGSYHPMLNEKREVQKVICYAQLLNYVPAPSS